MRFDDEPSRMTVTQCLGHWGIDDFEDAFFTELNEKHMTQAVQDTLQGMCCDGGYPSFQEWPEFANLRVEKCENDRLSGVFQVWFTEEQNTSCRDITFPERLTGKIHFSLNLSTGLLEFESTALERREFDPDEI